MRTFSISSFKLIRKECPLDSFASKFLRVYTTLEVLFTDVSMFREFIIIPLLFSKRDTIKLDLGCDSLSI